MLYYRSLGSGLLQNEMDCGRNAQYKELYIPPFPDFFSWTIRKDGRPDKRNPKSRVMAGKIIKKKRLRISKASDNKELHILPRLDFFSLAQPGMKPAICICIFLQNGLLLKAGA